MLRWLKRKDKDRDKQNEKNDTPVHTHSQTFSIPSSGQHHQQSHHHHQQQVPSHRATTTASSRDYRKEIPLNPSNISPHHHTNHPSNSMVGSPETLNNNHMNNNNNNNLNNNNNMNNNNNHYYPQGSGGTPLGEKSPQGGSGHHAMYGNPNLMKSASHGYLPSSQGGGGGVGGGGVATPMIPNYQMPQDHMGQGQYDNDKEVIREGETIKLSEIPSDFYEIKSEDIQLGPQLGEGGFGVVYEGVVAGQQVAIKKLKLQELNEIELNKFKKEVSLLCKLRHPNIVLLLGACMKPGELSIITELMKCSVKEIIHSKRELPLMKKVQMIRDTALAMNWLHKREPPILHLDLKPDNLLLDDLTTLRVKVTDFGLSVAKTPGKVLRRVGGTRRYMSPEAILKHKVEEPADVYSFSLVVWEILTRTLPFREFTKLKEEEQRKDHARLVCHEHRRPEIPADCPPTLARLLTEGWDKDPKERPTFENILDRLDHLSVEISIGPDDGAINFWKMVCGNKPEKFGEVSFRQFSVSFSEEINEELNDRDRSFLRRFVSEKSYNARRKKDDTIVTLDKFSLFVGWFGPLRPKRGHPTLLHRLRTLVLCKPDGKNKLFYPLIDAKEAENLLKGHKAGVYLLRTSQGKRSEPFTLSKVTKTGIKHQRLDYDAVTAVFTYAVTPTEQVVSEPGELVQDFLLRYSSQLGLLQVVFPLCDEISFSSGYDYDEDISHTNTTTTSDGPPPTPSALAPLSAHANNNNLNSNYNPPLQIPFPAISPLAHNFSN